MFIKYEPNGKITDILYVQQEFSEDYPDFIWFETSNISIDTTYIENNEIKTIPEQPGVNYTFNYDSKLWEFDYNKADTEAKQQRNQLLADGPDRINPMWWSSMSTAEQEAWTQYRQDLLDITSQPNYPEFIVWPTKP